MSKALELIRLLIKGANEYEKETGNKNPTIYLSRNNLLVIEKALQRLESIDNAEPSEALEAVKQIEFYVGTIIGLKFVKGDNVFSEAKKQDYEIFERKCNIIKQALLKAEKSLKALEIIKEKVMPLVSISDGCVWDGERYHGIEISEEDSILLKEVLR